MKKLHLVVIMLLFSITTFAQTTTPKVIAVINTATWCPTCQTNGQRVEKDVVASYAQNTEITFVVNNLSDKTTKEQSKETLEKQGVYKAVKKQNATGMIILVDAATKKIIKEISVKESTETLKKEIDAALNG